jgi:hypothetical protein
LNGLKEAHSLFKELIQSHINIADYQISGVVKNAITDGYFEDDKCEYKVMIKKSE